MKRGPQRRKERGCARQRPKNYLDRAHGLQRKDTEPGPPTLPLPPLFLPVSPEQLGQKRSGAAPPKVKGGVVSGVGKPGVGAPHHLMAGTVSLRTGNLPQGRPDR